MGSTGSRGSSVLGECPERFTATHDPWEKSSVDSSRLQNIPFVPWGCRPKTTSCGPARSVSTACSCVAVAWRRTALCGVPDNRTAGRQSWKSALHIASTKRPDNS